MMLSVQLNGNGVVSGVSMRHLPGGRIELTGEPL